MPGLRRRWRNSTHRLRERSCQARGALTAFLDGATEVDAAGRAGTSSPALLRRHQCRRSGRSPKQTCLPLPYPPHRRDYSTTIPLQGLQWPVPVVRRLVRGASARPGTGEQRSRVSRISCSYGATSTSVRVRWSPAALPLKTTGNRSPVVT